MSFYRFFSSILGKEDKAISQKPPSKSQKWVKRPRLRVGRWPLTCDIYSRWQSVFHMKVKQHYSKVRVPNFFLPTLYCWTWKKTTANNNFRLFSLIRYEFVKVFFNGQMFCFLFRCRRRRKNYYKQNMKQLVVNYNRK